VGYKSISPSDLLAHLQHRTVLPDRAFVITFDDGYRSVHEVARPIVQKYGFTAALYLVSSYCGRDNRWPSQPASVPTAPLMTWEQVSALAAEGWEVGAHTRSHPPLPSMPIDAAEQEIHLSRRAIEKRTGLPARTFAYPFGAVSDPVRAIVRRHFDGAFGTRLDLAGPESDPFELPRVDGFYLSPGAIKAIGLASFRTYLRMRQSLRSLRRRRRPDWREFVWRSAPDGEE
jgi:peptidoglycan/xylan/chitin deacetylase (PgdA/CDA1 family)